MNAWLAAAAIVVGVEAAANRVEPQEESTTE